MIDMKTAEAVKAMQRKLRAYEYALSIMTYDAETVMPSGGVEAYTKAAEFLAGEKYRILTDASMDAALNEVLAQAGEGEEQLRKEAEELVRVRGKMRKVPQEAVMAEQKAVAEGAFYWEKAKRSNDWSLFKPYLSRLIEIKKQYAKYIAPDRATYDVLLDDYERGNTREKLDAFFAELREKIVPLVKRVAQSPNGIDRGLLAGEYDVEKQKRLTAIVMQIMGIDENRCSIAEYEHPFTMELSKNDVRITTKYQASDVMSNLFSIVHEGGHAMYEMDIADELKESILGHGTSLAMHESQSRLWENFIGRSRPFCDMLRAHIAEQFPDRLSGIGDEDFYRAVNAAKPSLIRTEADELTYCLHIMVRYEVEKGIFDGTYTVDDLPRVWNALYKEYLGVDVPDDAHGVLQDCHWGNGDFGYFPTYAQGTAYAAQIIEALEKDVDIAQCCKDENFAPVQVWLTEKIHRFGMTLSSEELLIRATGKPFDPSCFTNYLTRKFTALYGAENK